MHIHIHALLHLIRLFGSVRFFGSLLPMLLFSLLQFSSGEPASSLLASMEDRAYTINILQSDNPLGIEALRVPDPVPAHALHENSYSGVFHRLKPRIVMIPRMNRTPKPKSVYRCFTRAPGCLAPAFV